MDRVERTRAKIDSISASRNDYSIEVDAEALGNYENQPFDVKKAKRELDEAIDQVLKEKALQEAKERINERKQSMRATKDSIALYSNSRRFIDGFAHSGHHTYLVGDAGSFKTTFATALCIQALDRFEALEVHYWGLDVSPPYSQAIVNEIDHPRFSLFENQTISDLKEFYADHIRSETRLDDTIIVLDTFKFLSNDINGKNANKDAMHFIKSICKLGAAWVSLGHTNKDGKSHSGTAEIEQDSDALLRIDSIIENGKAIASIKKAGRCRWGETNISLETVISEEDKDHPHLFWMNAIINTRVIQSIDIEKMKAAQKKAPQLQIIAEIISRHYADYSHPINKTKLIEEIRNNELLDLSQQETREILIAGEHKYWQTKRDKADNNKLLFYPI